MEWAALGHEPGEVTLRKKLVYLSSLATPQQIKFCAAMQEHFDAQFWFYESAVRTRGSFWAVDPGPSCRVLDRVHAPWRDTIGERYWAENLTAQLDAADPDILLLGGFSIPSNYMAYMWAKRRGKPVAIFTERSRNASGQLRQRGVAWRLLRWLYRDVDLVMVNAPDTVPQFRDVFGFGDKVTAARYACDLDGYFRHPVRQTKDGYTYLFANRMTSIYNPLGALDIFAAVRERHPGSRLLMNAAGEMRPECTERIAALGIADAVEFLDGIQSWAELGEVYRRSDILLLPANFSNGNFTILEAMASGMGLVVSDQVLGIGKMVQDGHNGFNCEPTTQAFVDRIERYISEPHLLRQHAAINRVLAAPHGAQGTATLYRDLLAPLLTAPSGGLGFQPR